MLLNYLKIAFRLLSKNRLLTGTQLIGLGIGLACCLLISLYVHQEWGYDQHHPDSGQIYRVTLERNYTNGEQKVFATSSMLLAGTLRENIPEISQIARGFSPQWTTQKTLVRHGHQRFYESRFLFADSTLFELLSFTFVSGDPATALRRPGSVVLTETMAHKYFGSANPLGKQIIVNDSLHAEVTGVLRDAQALSHLKADFIASFDLLRIEYGDLLTLWGWDLAYTYVRLIPTAQPGLVTRKIAALIHRQLPNFKAERGYEYGVTLQPIQTIHLHSNRQWELEPNGNATYVYALMAAAMLVLLVSCTNAISLQLTRLTARLAETGVRKALGADRAQLPMQWLVESAVLMGLSLLLALGLTLAMIPTLERLTGQSYQVSVLLQEKSMSSGLVGLILLIALNSLLPAIYFSRVSIPDSLKRKLLPERSYGWFSKGLLVGQLAASIFLLCASLVLYRQMRFLSTKNVGFQPENVLIVKGYGIGQKMELLRESFRKVPGVVNASAASGLPGSNIEKMRVKWDGQDELRPVDMLWIDEAFVPTLGLKMAQGRSLSKQFGSDSTQSFLINETAARQLGWTKPIGKHLRWQRQEGQIVGVIRDVHHASLHQPVEPLVMLIRPSSYNVLAIRFAGDSRAIIDQLQRTWQRLLPDRPFEYDFVDQQLARQYHNDERFGQVVNLFTGLSLLVAGLGLFAIAAFTAERRTKEIGVRKVLGASVVSVIRLLSGDFLKVVLIAIGIALPLAQWALSWWLQTFAYHVDVGGWVLALSGLLAILLVVLTVGLHSMKMALMNPVKSLRTE